MYLCSVLCFFIHPSLPRHFVLFMVLLDMLMIFPTTLFMCSIVQNCATIFTPPNPCSDEESENHGKQFQGIHTQCKICIWGFNLIDRESMSLIWVFCI